LNSEPPTHSFPSPRPGAASLPPKARRGPRSRASRVVLALLAGVVFAGFFALGTWQVQRRAWKLDLIARVEQRVHAPVADAPGPDRWAEVNAANDEYRHVRASGVFENDKSTLVQAVSDLGSGYWLVTPLRLADGSELLVNRGFVSQDWRRQPAPGAAIAEPVSVSGLLRVTEPGGAFLQKNDPAENRWYSRDVQAIAAARGLSRPAPYFVDADARTPGGDPAGRAGPAGGLTVIAFQNNHLVYALTWYGLALMMVLAGYYIVREERRRPPQDP
jgi:surfeit locus 1 family protein